MHEQLSAYDPFCLSSYLSFRYVVEPGRPWKKGVTPHFPTLSAAQQTPVKNTDELRASLEKTLAHIPDSRKPYGLLLSSGIDSATLAALVEKGTPAFTIRFMAQGAVDESLTAAPYAEHCRLPHHVVQIDWEDYLKFGGVLMTHKRSPLHPVEVPLYKASLLAREMGLKSFIVGNGADSTFGGLDKLLSRDWTLSEFIERYTFVPPPRVLKEPINMDHVYAAYSEEKTGHVDTMRFLKEVHGLGIVQSFENALGCAGMETIAPYEEMRLAIPLDIQRIRNGESKYMLRELFTSLLPGFPIPPKVAFARPMDQWMKQWTGPKRPEFLHSMQLESFTGEQRYIINSLEEFLNLMEDHDRAG